MTLSIVILSYALDDEVHQMNLRLLSSLRDSEDWGDNPPQILLIESNKHNPYTYPPGVQVIIPQRPFNFHAFLNIGRAYATGDFIAFCNNDILFSPAWFSSILSVHHSHPRFLCYSPIDTSYPLMASLKPPFQLGWDNKRFFAAWCFVWHRSVFDTIGPFDETFDFYAADDDELMTLRYHNIPSVAVTSSVVRHLSQVVTRKMDKSKPPTTLDPNQYPLTPDEIKHGMDYLWTDIRLYQGYQRLKHKWGNERMRHLITRYLDPRHTLRNKLLTQFVYNTRVNHLLCRLYHIPD